MEFVLAAAYTAFFLFLIGRLRFFALDGIRPGTVQLFFLYKVLAGVLMYLVYTYYYTDRLTADTFKYFDDSAVLHDLFFTDRGLFWRFMAGGESQDPAYLHYGNLMNTWWNRFAIYNDARTMIRFNAVLRFFTFGYYHVHSVVFAFLSFTGLVALARTLAPSLDGKRKAFYFLLFLFPSLAFWSSGIMKDGLIFLTLGFSLLFLRKALARDGSRAVSLAGLLVFMTALFFTKLHIFFLFVTCSIGFIWTFPGRRRSWLVYAISALLCTAALALALRAGAGIDLWTFAADKQQENIRAARALHAGSYIDIGRLDGTPWSVLRQAPSGFINALFRPLPFDRQSPVILVSTLENMFLILMTALALGTATPRRDRSTPWFWFSLFFIIPLFVTVGVMTPVLGAIVRYKIQGLPFLFYILLTLADKDKARKLPLLRQVIR